MTISDDRLFIVASIIGLALLLLMVGIIAALRARAKTSMDELPIDHTDVPDWLKSLAGATGKTLTGSAPVLDAPADALVVLRDPVSNDWVVEVNGLRYQNLKDIHDDQAATKILAAIGGLQRFAGALPIMTPPPAVEKPATPGASPSEPVVSPAGVPKLEPAIVAALAHASSAAKSKYPAPAGSLLDQIEQVLQRNLIRDPVLAQRRIHIGAAADGSLLFEVDWNTYKSADEVPDDDVRQMIKTSIQEWERSVR
jgi:hypothetical protein